MICSNYIQKAVKGISIILKCVQLKKKQHYLITITRFCFDVDFRYTLYIKILSDLLLQFQYLYVQNNVFINFHQYIL